MNITKDITVAELVTQNIKTSHIFKKHGIDFCCGGNVSIEMACKKKGLDHRELIEDLRHFDLPVEMQYNFNNWPLDVLIDHIITVHHLYVEENIPLILKYAEKVAKVHGNHSPEVVEINNLFQVIAAELSAHIKKEELILFPYVKKLALAKKYGTTLPRPHFNSVENPIHMLEEEHEEAGAHFREIARLSDHYTPPEHACNTFRALYDKLQEFENDLHRHVHLENNILHPKALQLEKTMNI